MAHGNNNPLKTLAKDFRKDQAGILDDWMDANMAFIDLTNGSISAEVIREQNLAILDNLIALIESGDIEDVTGPAFTSILDGLARVARAQADAQVPIGTFGLSLASLKLALLKHKHRNGDGDVEALFPLIDHLVFGTIEHFLNAREDFIKGIVETAADGIVTIDEKGTVQTFNKAAEEMFGYGRDEVIGKNIKMLMPPPYCDEHDSYLANYMRTGQAKVLGSRREVEGRRKDGTVFPVDLGVREVGKGAGRTFSGIVRDLTELKQAQEEVLRKSQDILELSTPVISVWKDVIVLPLIGTLDSKRTQDCMEKTLVRMSEENARVLIIDITGVPTVDTMVANHLIRLASSIRLMGGRCVLTGISPATAMTIVGLGIDLNMLDTRSNLAEGLKLAIEIAGGSNGPGPDRR